MFCRCVTWLLIPCKKVSPLILNDARSKKNGIFYSYVLVYLTDAIRKEFHPDPFLRQEYGFYYRIFMALRHAYIAMVALVVQGPGYSLDNMGFDSKVGQDTLSFKIPNRLCGPSGYQGLFT